MLNAWRLRVSASFAGLCVVAGLLMWIAPTARAQQSQEPAPGEERPVFRSGVDAIPIDITVLDRNRRPVRGLTAADFTILENGQPQPIVSFDEIVVPGPAEPTAEWMKEIGSDVVMNDADTRRLIVIVMDDGATGVEFGESRSARLVAHAIVDELGPSDMAAVVHTYLGRMENFTTDRTKLRAAIEAFTPQGWSSAGPPLGCMLRVGGCTVSTLARVGEVLATAPPGRKLVMFVGPVLNLNRALANPTSLSGLDGLSDMLRNLHAANASVYTFDPRGLMTKGTAPNEVALAEATGGRGIQNTNDPEWHVPDVFRENSSYYLLGYQSTNTRADGRFRRITVQVNRPDVTVHTRNGYFGPSSRRARASSRPALEPIDAAIGNGLAGGDLRFRASTAAFAMPGRREAEVMAVIGVRPSALVSDDDAGARPAAPRPQRVEVAMAAFDTGWRSRGIQRQTIEVTAVPGIERDVDVISRLRLAPGRYEIRLAAESGGRSGRVFVNIDVPDFARDALSLSDLIVGRPPADRNQSARAFLDVAPVVPTIARAFAASEPAVAFLRIYQDRRRLPLPVSVETTITNDRDDVVVSETKVFEAERFASGHAADLVVALPLSRLAPGEYLLSVAASAGEHERERHLRFSVLPEP